MSSSSPSPHSLHLGFRQNLRRSSPPLPPAISSAAAAFSPRSLVKTCGLKFRFRRSIFPIAAMEENFMGIPILLDESISYHRISDGENEKEADLINTSGDTELPTSKDRQKTSKAQNFAASPAGRRRRRVGPGVMINIALIVFIVTFLVIFDWYSWRIIRLPLGEFHLTRPFLISAVLSACAGWLYVPIVDSMNIHQILRKEGPTTHYIKKGTPTMGGLFFIPIGIVVARVIAGQSSIQLYGAALVTLAFAAIGLLDDLLSCMKGHNYGLPGWTKLFLQVTVGTLFCFWLESTNVTTPYNMKHLVPLPASLGLVHLGKAYLVLTAFCFASMANGVNLTDGLDGLAGGVAACAFIGMSVAVLAICPEIHAGKAVSLYIDETAHDLSIFGASMAGACVGFLFHNRYKASIFMGDTGSLALGGALAAMASCTGMFFPLFISSGVFVLEVLSVILQVSSVKITRRLYGDARRILRMAPLHHHFELCGVKEPIIVASAYFISFIFALCAGYIGLISA